MKVHAMLTRAAVSCMLATLIGTPSAAGQSAGVDYIYSYNGFSTAYQVIRDGATRKVAPFLPLVPGDRVVILKATDSTGEPSVMTLSIGGRLLHLDAAHSPFCVGNVDGACNGKASAASSGASKAIAVLESILASIAPIVGQAHDSTYSSQADEMVAQGSEMAPPGPAIPMLPDAPMAIEPSGSKIVSFGWLDGQAPFTVSIAPSKSSKPLVMQRGVSNNWVTIAGLHLTPGRYVISVEDSLQRTATGSFQCTGSALPKLAVDEISNDVDVPASTIAIIRAGLLVQHGLQYYLVAYQTLDPLPDDAPSGQVYSMRTWLAKGLPYQ